MQSFEVHGVAVTFCMSAHLRDRSAETVVRVLRELRGVEQLGEVCSEIHVDVDADARVNGGSCGDVVSLRCALRSDTSGLSTQLYYCDSDVESLCARLRAL